MGEIGCEGKKRKIVRQWQYKCLHVNLFKKKKKTLNTHQRRRRKQQQKKRKAFPTNNTLMCFL